MKKTCARNLLIGTVVGALVMASGAAARASILDDVQPPEWRDQPGTTSQYWLFSGPELGPLQPDNFLGQPWLPGTQIVVEPLGTQWQEVDPQSGRTGIWPLSGKLNITVANHPMENPVKHMWVQVVWHDEDNMCPTGPILYDFDPWGTKPVAVGPVDLGQGWYETTYKWEIYPNPRAESFVLAGNIKVDALIIDTWCTIPEPSALWLATLGGGLLLLPRWRRRP